MKTHRVMWSEGMFLLPQHFQQQDQFHLHQQAELGHRIGPFTWGVQELAFDTDALALGVLQLRRAKLVFPDGTLFDAPHTDPLPASRDLKSVLDNETEGVVYIALRDVQAYAPNCRDEANPRVLTRFREDSAEVADFNVGTGETMLGSLCLNAVLMFEGDDLDGHTFCPVGRLKRNSVGSFSLDENFVPPSLHIEAASLPVALIRRLLGILQAKSDALMTQRRERGGRVAEFGTGDVASFWLLQTVNRAYPLFRHLLTHPRLHVERLYLALAELAASLATFSMDGELADIPEYDHANPALSLVKLESMVRELLDTVIANRYVPITLDKLKQSYYVGRLHDTRLLDAEFYISVHADMPGAALLESVPRAFKVGSPDDIEVVVNTALPGVRLQHAPRVPSAIPVRLDNHYFALEPQGRMFERMMAAQAIAFYVPSGFPNLQLELMAVLK